MNIVALGVDSLSWEAYESVVYGGARVELQDPSRIDRHRVELERRLSVGEVIYGVNTGYGAEATQRVPVDALGRVQVNTVRSHAVGLGDPVEPEIVRGMLLLIAQSAAQGPPALRRPVVDALVTLLNDRVEPPVPELGSHSASDSVPAAHLALALLGEAPECETDAVELEAKDGSVVNNAAFSIALAVDGVRRVARLIERTEVVAAITLEALGGHPEAYDERLIRLRPHPGALAAAAHMRALLEGSRLIGRSERPHDPFSLRCLPQIHGAIRDAVTHARAAVEIDLCSVTDNPVVMSDGGDVLSGGNFHGEPLALPLDQVALAISELAAVSQRRSQHLVAGAIGAGTPPKLTSLPAERQGMLMLPSVAASIVSECRLRTQPASRESIPVDSMEDHVAMAALAARQVRDATLLARRVVAIELLCAAQALDARGPELASPAAQRLHADVRERVATLDDDRPLDAGVLLELV